MQEAVVQTSPRGLRVAVVGLAVLETMAGLAVAAAAYYYFLLGRFPELADSVEMSVAGISTVLAIVVLMTMASGAIALSRLGWRWLPSFMASPFLIIFGVLAEPREMMQVKAASIAFFAIAVLSWALGTVSYYDDLKG